VDKEDLHRTLVTFDDRCVRKQRETRNGRDGSTSNVASRRWGIPLVHDRRKADDKQRSTSLQQFVQGFPSVLMHRDDGACVFRV
jgi:hypothetical protein